MPGRPGRNLSGKFEIGKPAPATGSSARETLLTQEDGVLVVGLRMGPRAEVLGEPTDAGEQYYLVCTGALMQQNREVPPLGLIRVSPGEPRAVLKAGPQGAEVLLTQLPRATSRPGSDVKELAKRKMVYKLPEGSAFE